MRSHWVEAKAKAKISLILTANQFEQYIEFYKNVSEGDVAFTQCNVPLGFVYIATKATSLPDGFIENPI